MRSRLGTLHHQDTAMLLLPAFLLMIVFAPVRAATAQTGSVSGGVRAAGAPLPLARVDALAAEEVRAQTRADESGRYHLALPAGEYTLLFRLPGYAEKRVAGVRIVSGGSTTVDAELVATSITLNRVVVTAGRRRETELDVPASVAVVDESVIRERVALTPIDYAMFTPGVDVAVQGLQGRQFVARGFNATLNSSLLLLTDYRNASLPSPRANLSYFLSQSSEDIERVEIVRGPSSALYGPNAADGVVHFITKSPLDSPGSSLSVLGGGRELFEGAGRYVNRVSNRFGFKVSGTYFRGREWPSTPSASETIARDPITERASGEFRADLRVSPTATAILTLGETDALRVADFTQLGVYQLRNWRTDFAQLRFNDGKLFAQLYWNGNTGGGTSTSLQQGAVVLDHSSNLAAQLQHGLEFGGRTSVTYGFDLARTDPQTLGTIHGRNEEDDRSLEVGAYAQATTQLTSRLRLLTAARLDNHSRLNGTVFSPRVGFTYAPGEGHKFYASFNRAFSTPAPVQFSADIVASRLGPLPYDLRAVGVPKNGFQFARDCNGLCMSSPFAPGQQLPIDATLLWPAVVQILKGAGVDLSGIPAPNASDVRTTLRVLDLSVGAFRTPASGVTDLPALVPTITTSFEAGYKGLIADRLVIDAALFTTRRQNFIAPLAVITRNAFLATQSLSAYLARFIPAAQAGALAAVIGGIDGDPKAPGIPLASVGPRGRLAGSDILLTYQNVGDVRLWGVDLSAEYAATPRLILGGAYSWVNKNFFGARGSGEVDLSTNAPRDKAMASVRYRVPTHDFSTELRARYVGAFRMVDGVLVGDVKSFAVVDLEAGLAIPGAHDARLTFTVQNVGDIRHAEFFAHPVLGRLVMTRLQYRFP